MAPTRARSPGRPDTPPTLPVAGVAPASAGPDTDLRAFHRDGQTFLTWPERDDLDVDTYRIHRSPMPMDEGALGSETVVAEVGEGSARLWSERTRAPGAGPAVPPASRHRGPCRTAARGSRPAGVDAGRRRPRWRSIGRGLVRRRVSSSPTATSATSWPQTGPRATAADPRPVHVLDGAFGGRHLMLQYMDLSEWNPTFHAPHERDGWLGFDAGGTGHGRHPCVRLHLRHRRA